jgi:hypothetical protein
VFLDQRDGVALARQFSGGGGARNSAADDDDAKHGRYTSLNVIASGSLRVVFADRVEAIRAL